VTIFGTGFGNGSQSTPDGMAPTHAVPLQSFPGLLIDGNAVSNLQYDGLVPGAVGVDQINFQVPASTRDGCAVPVSAWQTLGSPSVTISIQRGRGQCIDPAIQSWGQIALVKSAFSGPGSATSSFETFIASFPSGPAVQPPTSEPIVFAPDYISNVTGTGTTAVVSAVPLAIRTCAIPGYSGLSAGSIRLAPQTGTPVIAAPLPLQTGGVIYSQSLPEGFIGPGTYSVAGTPGNSVSLAANLAVGSPIQLQTTFAAGTVISSSQPLTIKWKGGDLGSLVRVSLLSGVGLATRSDYSYAEATAGSLTIPPICSGNPISAGGSGVFCSFGLPLSSNAQLTVQVLPAPDRVTTIAVPGITGPVSLTWQYSYTFSGLSIGS
jgi:hypothetical protein